jgi:hydroxypyruvate isomerase
VLRFAANLSFLFQEFAFLERFEQAAKLGFKGVEFMFPYEWSAADLKSVLGDAGLTQVLFNLPPGDWQAGERGLACVPGREEAFRRGLDLALEYAHRLGCHRLHAMAGITPDAIPAAQLEATFLANMAYAADCCASAGVSLFIEPINNRIDMPGYWLSRPSEAFRLQSLVNSPALKVQLDLYHSAVMGEDSLALIEAHIDQIGHFQVADFPGRHEPGTGDIDFEVLLSAVEQSNFEGWIGCEYRPSQSSASSLAWISPWQGNA